MIAKLGRWAGGYLELRIQGYGAERFLNLLKSGDVSFWRVRQKKDGYYLFMGLKDFYRIRPLLRKSRVSMRIVARMGMPFFLHRNRKRKAFALAVLSFFVYLYVMYVHKYVY